MTSNRLVLARFCDDIRQEVGNKYSLMGCYGDQLFVDKFPTILGKLCAEVLLLTPVDQPVNELTFRALLDDDVLAELEVPKATLAKGYEDVLERVSSDTLRLSFRAMMVFSPLVLNQAGKLRIEATTDEGVIKGSSLTIAEYPPGDDAV